jgi:hypothetical protein
MAPLKHFRLLALSGSEISSLRKIRTSGNHKIDIDLRTAVMNTSTCAVGLTIIFCIFINLDAADFN